MIDEPELILDMTDKSATHVILSIYIFNDVDTELMDQMETGNNEQEVVAMNLKVEHAAAHEYMSA